MNELLLPRPILFEYYRVKPSPKQHIALVLRYYRDLAFGGQAGGGKSEFLLQDALQYVDVPGYHAIIIRKQYSDLAMPNALIDRSWKILGNDKRLHWNGDLKRWTFPSGATLSFGHLAHDKDLDKYQGAELAFIGIDEATQLFPNQILYLFSRLRRPTELKDKMVPLRFRLASNPGGPGHAWFKERYVDLHEPIQKNGGRIFIPSSLTDNPGIEKEEYIQNLMNLDPVKRRQLLEGDWNIAAVTGMFKRSWFKQVSYFELPKLDYVSRGWDLASTAPSQSNRDPDYTATVKIGYSKILNKYYLLDFKHWRLSPQQSEEKIKGIVQNDGYKTFHFLELEPGASSKQLLGYFQRTIFHGYPLKGMKASGNKVTRASPLSTACENGMVDVLDTIPGMDEFFTELELFPTKGIHDDFTDAFSVVFNAISRSRTLLMV